MMLLLIVGKVRKKLFEEVQRTTGKGDRKREGALGLAVDGNGLDLDGIRDERGDVVVSFSGGRSSVPSHIETSIEIDV